MRNVRHQAATPAPERSVGGRQGRRIAATLSAFVLERAPGLTARRSVVSTAWVLLLLLHRWSGRIYLVAGVLIAYSAVHLVLNRSFGGPSESAATIFFAGFFVCCLGIAFSHIRNRRVRQHREWMIRAFAIGLAVVTIRPVVGIYLALSDYSVQEILGTAFWISFTTHLIAAEVWIHLTRPQQPAGVRINRDSRSNSALQ